MAKRRVAYSFSKAEISLEEGKYVITEYSKDDTESYSLSDILDGFIGVDSITLTISSDDTVTAIGE
jgi:hypothetical protein